MNLYKFKNRTTGQVEHVTAKSVEEAFTLVAGDGVQSNWRLESAEKIRKESATRIDDVKNNQP